MVGSTKIVSNVSRFKPALNLNRVFGGFKPRIKFFKFGLWIRKWLLIIFQTFDKAQTTNMILKAKIIDFIRYIKVSAEEWQSIPDVGDSRNRKKRLAGLREKYTPISDRILSNGLGRSLNSALGYVRSSFWFFRILEYCAAISWSRQFYLTNLIDLIKSIKKNIQNKRGLSNFDITVEFF